MKQSQTHSSPLLPHAALSPAFERSFYRLEDTTGVSIVFGLYATDGRGVTPPGTGELEMRWSWMGNTLSLPKIVVYHDAWATLPALCDMQQQLADVANNIIFPDDFARILREHGFNERRLDDE